MQIISSYSTQLLDIVCEFIQKAKLKEYLVYGSLAFEYYTNQNVEIHDVDIVVKRNALDEIAVRLKMFPEYCNVFSFDGGLHINLLNYVGTDKKPFDISLDADDRLRTNIEFAEYTVIKHNGIEIKLMNRETLMEVYKIAAEHSTTKREAYTKKAELLVK